MITAEQLAEWEMMLNLHDNGSGVRVGIVDYADGWQLIRVAMPALLAEVERLRALLRDWDAVCKGHCDVEEIAAQVAEVLDV